MREEGAKSEDVGFEGILVIGNSPFSHFLPTSESNSKLESFSNAIKPGCAKRPVVGKFVFGFSSSSSMAIAIVNNNSF